MESFEPAWTVIHKGPDRYRIMVDPNFKINISFNGVSPESAHRVLN